MARRKAERWHEFEKAVARFVSALDPSARVRPDVRLPDRHTRRPRQRDVWVDARVGMFPVAILISCKRLVRRINELDIDHFAGELQSSRAHKGVLFSYSPFNEGAVEKATELGIECCRLYVNSRCDLPQALMIRAYCCTAHLGINPVTIPSGWGVSTLGDVFDIPTLDENDAETTVFSSLAIRFRARMKLAERQLSEERIFPSNWSQDYGVQSISEDLPELRLALSGIWKVFEASVDLHLLDGAYSHTTNEFVGTQRIPVPVVDAGAPGPGWREIRRDEAPPKAATLTWVYNPDTVEETLRRMREFLADPAAANAAADAT